MLGGIDCAGGTDCARSSLLHELSLVAPEQGLHFFRAWASHCSDFSCCGAQALGAWASVFAALRLSSCGTRP